MDQSSVEEFGALFTRFLREVVHEAPERESPLAARLREHLGSDPFEAPVTSARLAPFEHPDLQVALEAHVAAPGRAHTLAGSAGAGHHGMGFTDALAHSRGPLGAPDYVERPVDVDRQLACLRSGIVLVTEEGADPYAVVVTHQDHGPFEGISVGVVAAGRERGKAVLEELRALMLEHSVYRGKVLTLSSPEGVLGGRDAGARFLPREEIGRDAIVLPGGRLERIERRTLGFERIAGLGLSRKRGVLLYGPPGTGKTLTVRYLIGRMTGRTVVVLTGQALGAIRPAARLAGRLQPAALVLEDVDLVAHDRSFDPSGNPVLFELLDALDGLGERDADVVVLLTTNRADLLEPALAARPGRVDLAVELPLPDAETRAHLLRLYGSAVPHEVDDWDAAVERTEGTPPSLIKELVRTAALAAAERGADVVTRQDVDAALDELLDSGPLNASLLGARWAASGPAVPGAGPGPGPAVWGGRRGFVVMGGAPAEPFLTEEP